MDREKPICRRLRSKGFYATGPNDPDLVEFSTTSAYWCAQTITLLGPDDVFCSPEVCQPGRSCFES